MPDLQYKPFDTRTVPLTGSNLIEASAGTGKTYSIAILVLRMILEKNIPVHQILMVTFTRAAVAELEERIRKFIRQALRVAEGKTVPDATITAIVQAAQQQYGEAQTLEKIKEAVIFLDELSVMTIHSFCQQTLTEFAFETNQLFGADIIQDTDPLIEEEVQKFWRARITSIPAGTLSILVERNLSPASIFHIVKQHLSGKRFARHQAGVEYDFCEDDHHDFMRTCKEINQKVNDLTEALHQRVRDNSEYLKQISQKGNAFKYVYHKIDNPDEFLTYISQKATSKYITELYGEYLEALEDIKEEKEKINEHASDALDLIYCTAINAITKGVATQKLLHNQLGYDDLISHLHAALCGKKNGHTAQQENLVNQLQKKYKAVFIDEFQDTDRLQYEIFKAAFGRESIVFYIGDPKQSIYAFRKADIFTYFRAYDDVDQVYDMNVNYRSSARMIQAMNQFFLPVPDFDTFHFPEGESRIQYRNVEAPATNSKGELLYKESPVAPLTVSHQPNKTDISKQVAAGIAELLSDSGYTIGQNKIRPSDIGVLVRTKTDGNRIKECLSALHIPAITITDAKVFRSEEAQQILHLLEAMLTPRQDTINRALLGTITGYRSTDLLRINEEAVHAHFKQYKDNWERKGVYEPLNSFLSDFGVQHHLLNRNTENGERSLTNIRQITELLYKTEYVKNLSPAELISWYKRSIEEDTGGDELEQRIENDEEAVRIVTIHSSKGLEYPIVFAPFLDMTVDTSKETCAYRDPHTSEYISAIPRQMDEIQKELYRTQQEQENRRLIYVAITRAIYKCFVYKSTNGKLDESSLSFFINSLMDSEVIETDNSTKDMEGFLYKGEDAAVRTIRQSPVRFDLLQKYWTRMSYTMLAAELARPGLLPVEDEYSSDYDEFIFRHLRRGNITGNMLHSIFETIHFSDPERWETIILKEVQRFAPTLTNIYMPHLLQMAEEVMHARIQTPHGHFQLRDVAFDTRIHELEFDFPVEEFKVAELTDFASTEQEVYIKSFQQLEGIMNGKIDLFFEHQSKYYLLDWKSNFIGDTLSHYSEENLLEVMNQNNYHLQYLIYCVAIKKYLEVRLPDFEYDRDFGGVVYVFVRGVRRDSSSGIFYAKPSMDTISRIEAILSGISD